MLCHTLRAQAYTSWLIGDSADVSTNHQSGLLLAGGGLDNDPAMRWMLQRANGGDVVVLRASGSDGYNSYLYQDLMVSVNSVETIRIASLAAAQDPYVLRRVREAEVLFIAGGDQYDYYQYWRNTPLATAINYLVSHKQATLGGTSAGMAILGDAYYAPSGAGISSSTALNNPYAPEMNVLDYSDFIRSPWLSQTITDTHFDQRNRAGRLVTFMARMETDWRLDAFAIACNEQVAVCVGPDGIARIYGDTLTPGAFAYFVQSHCNQPFSLPEQCIPNMPLEWNRNGQALRVYKVQGTRDGSRSFDLKDWRSGTGGAWEDWHITGGVLKKTPSLLSACTLSADTYNSRFQLQIRNGILRIDLDPVSKARTLEILSSNGQRVFSGRIAAGAVTAEAELRYLTSGCYVLRMLGGQEQLSFRFVIQP